MKKTTFSVFIVLTILIVFAIPAMAWEPPPGFLGEWGSGGSGNGQFNDPRGVAVDPEGYVYVADTDNHRIQKFSSAGGFIRKWGSNGSGDGQFTYPFGVAVDSSGNVFVADKWNDRIQKFDKNGVFIRKWGSHGSANGQFNDPEDVAVDSNGNVYVADTDNSRIQVFTTNGGFITKWFTPAQPHNVAADSQYVYVGFAGTPWVRVYTHTGTLMWEWTATQTTWNGITYASLNPRGIAVDSAGYVYVADDLNHLVRKFTREGTELTSWGVALAVDPGIWGIAVSNTGKVYVVDKARHGIEVYGEPPAAPSRPDLAAASDSGISDTDNKTNDNTPNFTGTAEPNSTVTLYNGSTPLGSATANSSGGWSITSSTLADGSYSITAKAANAWAQVSPASPALALIIDTQPPTTPSIPDMVAASDSGESNSDNITNDGTPSLTGTAEASSTVYIYKAGVNIGNVTANSSGNWSFTMVTLTSGVYPITVSAKDAAGNWSAVSPTLSLFIDTSPPAAPSALDLVAASDTGASNTDNVTSDTTPTFTGTGAVPDGPVNIYYKTGALLGSITADSSGNWNYTTPVLVDSDYTFWARTTDLAGNQSASSAVISVKIRNRPPVANAGGPYTASEGSSISFNPVGSSDPNGLPLQYRWDFENDGTWDTAQSSGTRAGFTWINEWSGTVKVEVFNGFTAVTDTAPVTVNNVVPVVNAGVDATINQGGSIDLSGSFTDPGSDTWTASVDYGDGSGTQPLILAGKTFNLSHTYPNGGQYILTVSVNDGTSAGTDTVEVTVVDTAIPTTVATVSPSPNSDGWNKTDVTIDFSATDNAGGSGVREIHYSVNGGSQTVVPGAVASLSLTGEGTFNIAYFAIDNGGEAESAKTKVVRIDKTPPQVSGAITPQPNAAGWNNTDVTATFTASDGLSGIASFTPPLEVTAEGAGQSVTGTATDKAGNTASATVNNINIDRTPPSISGSRAPLPNANGWNNTDVTVSFAVSDSLSGIESFTAPTVVSTEGGGQSVTGTATDKAGNSASVTVADINIDKTPPVISIPLTPEPNASGWNNTDVTATFAGYDSLSGIDTITAPVALTTEGAGQSATGTAMDKAGNSSSASVSDINIDKTPPVITASRTPESNAYGWTNTDVAVIFNGTDSLSGIDTVTAPTVVSTEGAGQSVTGTATDKAGNSASATVSNINIDRTPPTISGSRTPEPDAEGWNDTDVTVTFTGSDGLSGIDTVTAPIVVSTEGEDQSVTGAATDKAGNSASATVSNINIRKPLSTSPAGVRGDANGDGQVNALDITAVERIIAGLD